MASTDSVRAMLDEATATGIREGSLRGIVSTLVSAVRELCDEVDAQRDGVIAAPSEPGVFVPDDFALAPEAGAGDGNG